MIFRDIIKMYALLLLFVFTSCSSNHTETTPETYNKLPTKIVPIEIGIENTDTPAPGVTDVDLAWTATPQPPNETDHPTETATPSLTPEPAITKLLFTGAIVPGRCVQAAIDERGNADYLYEDVRELISDADIAVGTLNAALSDYPPQLGCIRTFVLVGSSVNADAMANAGFDLMNMSTNHIKNCGLSSCGDRAFLDTLENLERVGIQKVGAGKNIDEAMAPVVIEKNGIRFGFVALGEIESRAFASQEVPGIAPLPQEFDEAAENLRTAIQAAREVSDVVIAMPHWGSDYSSTPNYRQLSFDRVAVEAGADLVIGTHPHVIQGMREIEGIPVFYSLGSFVFDQDWSLETQQGIVVVVTFREQRLLDYAVIPVHIDGDGHVQVAEAGEFEEILGRFEGLSEDLK
jgi:poly-gamma-glutamate capsule biosynthesis protein CapA/YwtB (metallophosphatase superfamily)